VRVDVLTTKGAVSSVIARADVSVRPTAWRAALAVRRRGDWVPWAECAPCVGDECAYVLTALGGGVPQSAWTQSWSGGSPASQSIVVGATTLEVRFTLASVAKHRLTATATDTGISCVVGEGKQTDPSDAVTRGTILALPSLANLALTATSLRQTQRLSVEMTRDASSVAGEARVTTVTRRRDGSVVESEAAATRVEAGRIVHAVRARS
jgi:hypothetical protein